MSRTSALAALTAVLAAAPLSAQIGLASSPRSVQLTAIKHGSVSVALPGGNGAFASGLTGGVNDFTAVPVATSWNVDPERTASVTLVAWLGAPGRALAGPGGEIPAAAMQARVGSGPGFAPFVPGSPAAGDGVVSLVLFRQPIAAPNAIGSRTDDLQVRIDLSTLPGLAPGTYTGALSLVAVTQ